MSAFEVATGLFIIFAFTATPFGVALAITRCEDSAMGIGMAAIIPWTLFGLWLIQ